MENKYIFNDIYNDFFGKSENKENVESDFNIKKEEINEEDKNEIIVNVLNEIENLYITEDSKKLLKKIIEYMQRYDQKIEKKYIPFNIIIYSNNYETSNKIIELIKKSVSYLGYLKNSNIIEKSIFKVENIDDTYTAKNSIVVLKDFEEIANKEKNIRENILHDLKQKARNVEDTFLTILISNNKDLVEKNIQDVKDQIIDFEINSTEPDLQEIYQEVLEKLQNNAEVLEEVGPKLIDYISATYSKNKLDYPDYRDKLINKILFNKDDKITVNDIPEYEEEKSLEEIFKELNELVGLSKVKKVLYDLVDLIELKNKSNGELNIKNTNLHMVFLGNPGTGKTTVARIISKILYSLKYIKQDKLMEVSSKDLVGEYVGQTAPKTMAVIEKAKGGVLFIDEAYSLASGNGQGNSYNEEAIATLIQEMENNRDNLVVIFAGYTKEMQNFLNSNSGIVSRIGYTLEFEDYTENELLEIFKSMITKAGFKITKEALEKALNIIKENKGAKNFGNARFVRNMYEKTVIQHASNTKGKKAKNVLKTIEKDDISIENLYK